MTSAPTQSPIRHRGSAADRRQILVDAALDLLDDVGPAQVTTRKLAAAAGVTTMAVYTEFGSIGGVAQAVVEAGFAQLGDTYGAVARTDDPVADLLVLGARHRQFALNRAGLYGVMFGSAALGGHRRTGEELVLGIDTFEIGVSFVERAMNAGRLRAPNAFTTTAQLWSAMHGALALETSGMLGVVAGDALNDVLIPLFTSLFAGLGDAPDLINESVQIALQRLIDSSSPAPLGEG